MAVQAVPTKGNLMATKKSLALAKNGFELLDKKRNILIREMMMLIDKASEIQDKIDSTYHKAYKALEVANITLGFCDEISKSVPEETSLKLSYRSVMGVEIPIVTIDENSNNGIYFSISNTNSSLDEAYLRFHEVKELTAVLAEVENSVYRLADAIKKTQKRANALKNVMIPKFEATVKFITEALEEKEREEFSRLKVIKIDKDTGDVIKRSGIKFKIINAKTKKYVKQTITYPSAKTIDTFETDENGILITPYPLESGTYFLEEVDQKIDGYLWNKNSVEFTIDENSKLVNDDEFGILYEVKFENKAVKGSLELTKTGEKVELTNKGYVYTEINLKDVKIGLYANEDIYDSLGNLKYKKDTLIKILITDENGYAKVENLFLGKYYLQEIETINNHILDKTKYTFELKYKDQYTKIINYTTLLKNHLPKGTLEFTKSDFSNDKTLPNTLIEIYTENDELVYVGRTDSNGKIIINELPLGKYYIIEKQAPEGYKINPDKMWFEILEDGKIVKAIMKDEVIEVPNTGVNDSHIIDIIGLVFITGGVGFIIYDKKRKK